MQTSHIITAILLIALGIQFSARANESRVITYSWAKSMQADARGHYPVALLHLALSKSGQQFVTAPSDFAMTQYRTLKQLELNHGIDVTWTMTNPEREKNLLPIRIPIDRGLIGWRLLAIRAADAEFFENLQDEQAVKSLLTVQGIDWPDYAILQHNQFRVTGSNYFDGMYQMLHQQRVRYFARSISEINPEMQTAQNSQLAIAPRWVLHYPAASYFFVRKSDTQLANAIASGLEVAIADGSMKQLFVQHFGAAIDKAQLSDRQIIELQNPELPATAPLHRQELWFDPKLGY